MDFPMSDAGRFVGTAFVGQLTLDSILYTTPSSPNMKGDWARIVNLPTFDAQGLKITFRQSVTASDERKYLVDLGIGSSNSIAILCHNVLFQYGGTGQQVGRFDLPVTVPKSTEIWVRGQSQVSGTANIRVSVGYFSSGFQYPSALGAATTTYGVTVDSTAGTQIDPGAIVDTKGAYFEISSTITSDIKYAVVCVGNQANQADANMQILLDIAIGAAGSEVSVISDLLYSKNTAADDMSPPMTGVPVSIPAGARLSARAMSDITNAVDRLFDVAVIGVS